MSKKTEIRSAVIEYKKQYDTRNNPDDILEATIAYGVYRAIGGEKVIPLPPFTDGIFDIVNKIAIVKLRAPSKIIDIKYNNIERGIKSNLKSIVDIKFYARKTELVILLKTENNEYRIVTSIEPCLYLTEIAYILASELQESKISMENFKVILMNYLNKIGREHL